MTCKTSSLLSIATLLAVSILGQGCATNRGIIDVRMTVPPNPSSGKTVRLTKVTDQRKFEASPRSASIPSLRGNDVYNKAITIRAIARKRNGYGKALGDIVLPEGRTVEDLVREALTTAFRESGYRVTESATSSQPDEIPVESEIEQFWAWVTPGFWAMSMEFEANVRIKGNVGTFSNGQAVRGYIELHTQAAGTRAWTNTLQKGIDEFVAAVRRALR